MGIKSYKPTSAGKRWLKGFDFKDLDKNAKPEKSLLVPLKKHGGRNSHGRVTSRRKGGGHKQKLRIIDFVREKRDITAKVISIQYDPSRTGRVALLEYSDGDKRYIVSPLGLRVNDEIIAASSTEIKIGNAMELRHIPPGIPICNVEMKKGKGAQIARSAGNSCTIMAKEGNYAHVRLPSGEVRLISIDCFATVGQIGNVENDAIRLGKAGKSRYLGVVPRSRGVAKNPIDHPMGGGEGKSSGGRHPTTPWGKCTKGLKTRKAKPSDKLIIKRRK
ncbi:MAG: 50S ribosomal protein L2 [Candidatus Omnitrophica bacterium]|nr:50S ribosomal protein L2 [Candidatus Omnitrophota bacterium]